MTTVDATAPASAGRVVLATMRLADLEGAPYNPRTISPEALTGLGESVRRFGLVQPVIWNRRTRRIVGGHQRVKALAVQGVVETDVVVVDLPEGEEKALNLALNSQAIAGEWTPDALALIDEVAASMPDLASALRFAELRGDVVDLLPCETRAVTEDSAPPPPEVPTTKPGDLWILGRHRILCGDSTKPETFERLMEGATAELLATDPPYLVDYTGERPNDSGKDWTATYREIDIEDADGFFRAVFTNVLDVLGPKGAIYCWHAHKRCGDIQRIWRDLGILDHQQIIWVKPTPVFGRVYWHFRHEPCVMGWRQGDKPDHDGVHEHDSVWECDWDGKAKFSCDHPTSKPVELFVRPIKKHTSPGDVVFEPFSGSGSQLIAAERTGRRCRAIEITPAYVDVAVLRWQKATGLEATLDGDGRTFAAVAAERGATP